MHTVLLLRCCCKLESCGPVLLFYCCKLRSCIVVSTPHCGCGNPSSILGLDTMLTNGVKQVGYAAGLVVQYYSDEL